MRFFTRLARVFFAGVAALALCATVRALDPTRAVKDYRLTEWVSTDGLPYPAIRAIAQSGDGYLWLATRAALTRFDGLSFTAYTTANLSLLPSDDVQTVCADRDGTLWVGTIKGVLWYRNGEWSRPALHPDLDSRLVSTFLSDPAGGMWIGTDSGVFHRSKDGTCEKNASFVIRNKGQPQNFIWTIGVSSQDEVFVTGWGLFSLRDGKTQSFAPSADPAFDETRVVVFDRFGGMWIGTGLGLYYWKNGQLRAFGTRQGLPANSVRSLFIDHDDNVWVGTTNGLSRFSDGKFQDVTRDGERLSHILCLGEDREGNLWVGSDNGLFRLRDLKVTTISQRDGLRSNSVLSVLEAHDGSKWIGTWGGGLAHLTANGIVSLTAEDGLLEDGIYSLAEDDQGGVWIGYNAKRLSYLKNGKLTHYGAEQGVGGRVRSIAVDHAGVAWIAVSGTVKRFNAGRFEDVKVDGLLESDSCGSTPRAACGSSEWILSCGGSATGAGRFSRFPQMSRASRTVSLTIRAVISGRRSMAAR